MWRSLCGVRRGRGRAKRSRGRSRERAAAAAAARSHSHAAQQQADCFTALSPCNMSSASSSAAAAAAETSAPVAAASAAPFHTSLLPSGRTLHTLYLRGISAEQFKTIKQKQSSVDCALIKADMVRPERRRLMIAASRACCIPCWLRPLVPVLMPRCSLVCTVTPRSPTCFSWSAPL